MGLTLALFLITSKETNMTLYQVILNRVEANTPVFQTREEALALITRYSDYMKLRGCVVTHDNEDFFSAIWGGWSENKNTMWVREIQTGKIPETWMDF